MEDDYLMSGDMGKILKSVCVGTSYFQSTHEFIKRPLQNEKTAFHKRGCSASGC